MIDLPTASSIAAPGAASNINEIVLFLGTGFVFREIVRHYGPSKTEDALVKLLWSAIASAAVAPIVACAANWNSPPVNAIAETIGPGFLQLLLSAVLGLCAAAILKLLNTDAMDEKIGWIGDKYFKRYDSTIERALERHAGKAVYLYWKDGSRSHGVVIALDAEAQDGQLAFVKVRYHRKLELGATVWSEEAPEDEFLPRSDLLRVGLCSTQL